MLAYGRRLDNRQGRKLISSPKSRTALEETTESESKPEEKPEETVDNMIQNGDFGEGENQWKVGIYAPAEGSRDFSDGKAVFTINNPGEADWNAQMKQQGLNIERGATYKISFDIESTAGELLSFEQTLTIEKTALQIWTLCYLLVK